MAENIAFKITGDAGPITESVKGLKAQLREATEDVVRLSSQFGSTSQQAIAAARSAANLREQIADSRDLIAAFHPEQKFAAFGAAIQGVTGGFSALTGAMGLFGADSENLQKTLVKVQSAMALSEGINSILSAKDAFMNLGAVVKGPIVSAFNFLKTAMTTNPIMLLVTVLAGVVLSFKKTRDAIMNFIPGLKQLVGWIGDAIDTVKGWIGASDEAAEAQEKLKEATDELNESMDKQITAIDKATERLKLHAEYAGKAQSEIEKIDQQGQAKKKEYYDNLLQQAKTFGVYNEGVQKLYDERVAALQDENMKKEISRRSSHTDTVKKIVQKKVDDTISIEKQAMDELEKLKNENFLNSIKNDAEREKERIKQEFRASLDELASKKISDDLRLQYLNEFKVKRDAALGNVDADTAAKQAAIDKDIADKKDAEEKTRLENHVNGILAIKKALSDKALEDTQQEIANDEAIRASKDMLLGGIGSALGAISNLFAKNTAASKIAALAEIAIGTGVGFINALQIAQKSAKAAGPGAAFAFPVFYATQLAAVLGAASRAKNILGAGGGGGASASAPNVASVSAPLAPQAQVTNTRIDQGQVNAMGNATVRAFVVESDVSGSQERIRRLNRAARI